MSTKCKTYNKVVRLWGDVYLLHSILGSGVTTTDKSKPARKGMAFLAWTRLLFLGWSEVGRDNHLYGKCLVI